jgi:hypothetical protein
MNILGKKKKVNEHLPDLWFYLKSTQMIIKFLIDLRGFTNDHQSASIYANKPEAVRN